MVYTIQRQVYLSCLRVKSINTNLATLDLKKSAILGDKEINYEIYLAICLKFKYITLVLVKFVIVLHSEALLQMR